MRLSGTDLRLLRVFDSVVRHGGFAAAQTELNVGLSTISNHITALEQRLGVNLCQRGRGGFRLSEKGKLVFSETQKLLRSIDSFSVSVTSLKGKLVGEVKLGLVDAIATDKGSCLHRAFEDFLSQPNDIRFMVSQKQPQELQKSVLSGELDLAIGSLPHKATGLDYQTLYTETHSLYCGRGHDLFFADRQDLTIKDLSQQRIVGRGYWRDQSHAQLGFENTKAIVYEIEPQLILIRSSCFIGYLPDHFANKWVEEGELRKLSPPAPPFTCQFDLITKRGVKPSRALAAFITCILKAHTQQKVDECQI